MNMGFAARSTGQSFTTVPSVVGEAQAQGTADIEAQGLTVSVVTAYSSVVAAGLIISQVPTGGSQVSPGSNVQITVSLGDQPVTAVDTHDGLRKRKPKFDDSAQTQVIRESDLKPKQRKARKSATVEPVAPIPSVTDEDLLLYQMLEDDEVTELLTLTHSLLKGLH